MTKLFFAFIGVAVLLFFAGCEPVSGGKYTPGQHKSSAANASNTLQASDFSSEYLTGAALVYFSKPGCPACGRQDPEYQKLLGDMPAGTRAIKVFPYMVDLDRYGVDELPTLVVYRDGKPVKRFVGVTSASRLRSALESAAN